MWLKKLLSFSLVGVIDVLAILIIVRWKSRSRLRLRLITMLQWTICLLHCFRLWRACTCFRGIYSASQSAVSIHFQLSSRLRLIFFLYFFNYLFFIFALFIHIIAIGFIFDCWILSGSFVLDRLLLKELDQLDVIVQIAQFGIVQNFFLNVLSDILEFFIVFSTLFQLFEYMSQQCECSTVKCSFSQSLDEVSLPWNIEFICFCCDNEAKKFGRRNVEVELPATVTFYRHIKQLEGVLNKQSVETWLEEYLPKRDVLRNDKEAFRYCDPRRSNHLIVIIHFY